MLLISISYIWTEVGVPEAPLTNFNDEGWGGGGPREVHILYPKKSQLQNLSTPKNHNFRICLPKKNHYFFYHTQKNPLVLLSQLQKIPLFFFATQKNPGIFFRPQKITFGQNIRPKKITWTPQSLKYVSGAPGVGVQ